MDQAHQPQVGHRRGRRSEATRYLCAAAHLDEAFRSRATQGLLSQPHRAVAPSYGIDVVPILRHCLSAQRRVITRDVVLSLILLVALLVVPAMAWPAWLLGLLIWGAFTMSSLRAGPGVARSLTGGRQWGCLGVTVMLAAMFALGWIAVVGLGVLTRAFAEAFYLLPLVFFGSRNAALVALGAITLIGIFPLLTFVTILTYRLMVHADIVDALQPEAFATREDPAAPAWALPRLDYLAEAQYGNVTYVAESTSRSPFIGSGVVDGFSSFAIPLVRHDDDRSQVFHAEQGDDAPADEALTAPALYERLRRSLAALGHPDTEHRLSGLSLQDRLYVNGRLRPTSEFLTPAPARPRYRVGSEIVEEVTDSERGQARRYLVVRVETWAGEVESSVFFYVAVRGDMLYVEYVETTLPPIAPRYHAIDSYERLTAWVVARQAAHSVVDLVRMAPGAPARLLWVAQQYVQRLRIERSAQRQARTRLAYDYGAQVSLRELGAAPPGWFAQFDAQEIQKVIVRRALGAIADSLAELGYDLMEFDARANVVINQSTTNLAGATIRDSHLATGSSSTLAAVARTTPRR